MTDLSNGSQNCSVKANNSLPKNKTVAITEADVLITEALTLRPARLPDYAAESQALRILAQQLTDEPQSLLKTLVNLAQTLCRADTVGVSLLETDPNGESIFRWVAIAGALEFLEQTTTPSNFSPCGTTLFGNQPQLYTYPERYFNHLHHPQFSIVEELLIPLSVKQRRLGTLWIISHTEGRQFDAEDLRLINSLAGFTTSALQSIDRLRQTAQLALQREQETKKALHDSQNQFEALVANVPGIVFRYSPSTDIPDRFTFINESCRELLELEPEAILQDGTCLVALIHPEDLPSFQTSIAYAIENFLPWRWEGRMVTPSGQLKWIQGSSRAVETTQGNVWDGLLIDITEYKQAEAALSQSEEFNRQILESSDDCIKVLDLLGRILYMSPGGQALLKISDITPFLNSDWSEFWQGAEREAARNAIAQAEAGRVATFQGYRPTETGEPKWWDSKVSPIKSHDGQVKRLLCISRDITERLQAQKLLIESEARYRTLTDLSPDAIVVNLNGQFIYANSVAVQLLGATDTEQIIGREPFDFIEPQYHDLVRERIKRALQQQLLPALMEQRWRRLDGLVIDVEVSAGTTTWEGQPAIQVILRDITARKRREANLAFLAEIGEDFSRLSTADEIMQAVGAKIGAYLNITTCNFTDVDEARGEVTAHYGWNSKDVPSTVGTFRITQYLSEEFERASRAGETFVIRDTQSDPRTDASGYAALNMHSFVTVPFHRNGRWTHYIAICDSRPRNWRDDEIEVIEEISNRIFPRLERARAEDALRQNESKYRTLFESMDEGFCILQLIFNEEQKPIDYRYIEINPAFEQQTGMRNALGRTIRELVPDIEEFWFDIYCQVALTGEQTRFINHAESMGRWFDVYAFRIGEPHERKVAVLFKDISERKQAEAEREQLLKNERHYGKQLQGLTTAALAINSALSVEEVLQVITDQAASIVGVHQSVTSLTINQNWAQAINAVRLSDKYAAWRNYNGQTDGSGIYACVCHLNRSMRMTQAELEAHPRWKGFGKEAENHPPMRGWLAAPLIGRNGDNIGLIQLSDKYSGEFTETDEAIIVQLAQMASVAVENARLYEAQQQARSAAEVSREEAQAANRVKDEFLAVLSHELRTPLNPIIGWSTLLLNRKLDEAKTAQALATIQRNAKLQSELIEDLLDVSRILRGKLSLNVAPVDLAITIRGAMETVRLAAEAKSIGVQAIIEPDVGLVSGDSTRLQQVIWNLLSNAVKFTPQGGQVNIRLERLDSCAKITVTDTGQGIEPEFLPYVFDYFRQANAETTRKFGGLGLGLAIMRHLVELHGGTVKVESSGLGQGATFIIQLPLLISTQTNPNYNSGNSDGSEDLSGIQVLVVDDEIDSRDFIAFLLEQSGAQVTAVSSANEALDALTQSKFDVLLSDIGMPDVNGYMLIEQVRTKLLPPNRKIPAIALTAYAGEINRRQALDAGFQIHISKPLDPEVLVQTISSFVRSTIVT
jgi:PAS domain S-box-containing protein